MATALSFLCYELAINPEVQQQLHDEIEQIMERENEITYDDVMFKMSYLDMVVKGKTPKKNFFFFKVENISKRLKRAGVILQKR